MKNENKDKVILALIIAIAILTANNFFKDKDFDLFTNSNKSKLVDNFDDQLKIEDSDNNNLAHNEDIEKKVHISGEIKNSGVYTIKEGDRLDDLIKKAGGLTDLAYDKDLNLAMKLEDQMKIYIPSINDEKTDDKKEMNLINSPNQSLTTKININKASKEELMNLPNIGEKRAEAIIEYREVQNFTKIEDIKNVTGIGDKYYEAMEDLITVGDF